MALSSSSLFHFTKGGTNVLKSILSNGFRVSYCEEVSTNAFVDHRHSEFGPYLYKPSSTVEGSEPFWSTIMVPMICFCDIPLANIKYHVEKYGKYAIGVEKNWGIKNGLNPVFYIARNSLVAHEIHAMRGKTERPFSKQIAFHVPYEFTIELYDYDPENNEIIDNRGNIYPITHLYLKPLGEYIVNHATRSDELVYYQDEKEWRYIPARPYLTILNHRSGRSLQAHLNMWNDNLLRSYKNHRKNHPNIPFGLKDIIDYDFENNKKEPSLQPYPNLPFDLKDITFIIVEKEAEIADINKFLLDTYSSMFSDNNEELYTLLSKITSFVSPSQILDSV